MPCPGNILNNKAMTFSEKNNSIQQCKREDKPVSCFA